MKQAFMVFGIALGVAGGLYLYNDVIKAPKKT